MALSLTINKNILQDALNLAIRAISPRSTLAILECILLTAEDGTGVTLSASSLDINIKTAPINAEINIPGEIALEAKLFSEIIRKMPGENISIVADHSNHVEVKSGRTKLNISGQSGEEFPKMTDEENIDIKNTCSLGSNIFKDMIKQTIFAVSTDITKNVLTGELLEIRDNTLRIVAVDMFRIAYSSTAIEGDNQDIKAIVPAKALNELSRMLPSESGDTVEIQIDDKKATFVASTFILTSNLIQGEFIKYDQIFNDDFATLVEINRNDLLAAVERSILVAVESKMNSIRIEINDDDLLLRAESEIGITEDGLPCTTHGKHLLIAFNSKYIIEALRAVESDTVVIKFNTQHSPCSIRGVDDNSSKHLVIPVRLSNVDQ